MPDKPKFDPNKPFDEVKASKPAFNPNEEYSEVKKKPSAPVLKSGTPKSSTGLNSFLPSQESTAKPLVPTVLVGKAREEAKAKVIQRKEQANKDNANKPTGGAGTSFMKGLNTFNESIFKIPRYLYDLASVPQNAIADLTNTPELRADYDSVSEGKLNPLGAIDRVGTSYGEVANSYEAKKEKFDKGVFDSLADGDFKSAGKQVLNNIAESAPSIAGMMLTGGVGNAAKAGKVSKTLINALPFSSSKNTELQDNPDVPAYIKPINATLNGLAEVVFDQDFGTKAIIDNVIDVFQKEGRDAAIAKTKDFVIEYTQGAIGKIQPLTSTVKNSIEEMATQLSQNIIDRATVNPNLNITQGMLDAGIIGGATGGAISGAGTLALSAKQKQKLNEASKRRDDIVADLDNENLPDEIKDDLTSQLEKANNKIAKISDEAELTLSNLPESEQKEAVEAQNKIEQLEQSLNAKGVSESTKKRLEEQIEKEQDKLDELAETSTILSESKPVEEEITPEPIVTEPVQEEAIVESEIALDEPVIQNESPTTVEETSPVLNKNISIKDDTGRKGLVPVSELEGFIGEDRLGNAAMSNSRETIDKLKADISKNGFKEPIVLVYDKFSNGGEASILEGNHRIAAAKELGLKEIPVTFEKGTLRTNESRSKDNMFPLNRKSIGVINDTMGVKGSDLGLSVRQPNKNDYINEQGINNTEITEPTQPIQEQSIEEINGVEEATETNTPVNEENTEVDSDPITASEEEGTVSEAPEATALKNADIAKKREELGLPKAEEVVPEKDEDIKSEAVKRVKEGFDVYSLMDDIKTKGKTLDRVETVILKQFQLSKENEIVDLGDKIVASAIDGKGPDYLNDLISQRDKAYVDIQRAFDAGKESGREQARDFRARQIKVLSDFSLANLIGRKFVANDNKQLTKEQIEEVTNSYQKIEALNKQYEQKIKDLEEQNINLLADKSFKKLKKQVDYEQRKYGRVVQRESIDKDIDDTLENLKKKLRATMGKTYANPIPIEMIPDIAKLAKLYTKKGINNLADVIDSIHQSLQGDIEGLTRDHVKEILAGYDYAAQAKEDSRLQGFKTRSENRLTELRNRMDKGDYSRKIVTPIKLDKEGTELRNELYKAKEEYEVGLQKDKMRNRTDSQKGVDVTNNIIGLAKSLKATLDLSAPFRQGALASVNHPIFAAKTFIDMHKAAASEKYYDNWRFELMDSPNFELMEKAGLSLTVRKSANVLAKEEDFASNLGEKIPLLKIPIKGSERAYSYYLNSMRAEIFNSYVKELEAEGMTFEKNKKEFESIARVINNETGRGGLGRAERHADLAGLALWSPRLLMSRVNTFTSLFDRSYSSKARMIAAKDLGRFVMLGASLLFMASANDDWDIEWNPLSSNFGKIKRDNTRYSVLSGYESYITLIARLIMGQTKNKHGKIVDIDPEQFGKMSKWDYIKTFFRGKSSPEVGIVLNLMDGKDVVGNKYTYWDVPDEIIPLVIPDMFDAYRMGGIEEVLETLPFTTYGVGVSRYDENKKRTREDGMFESGYKAIAGTKTEAKSGKYK